MKAFDGVSINRNKARSITFAIAIFSSLFMLLVTTHADSIDNKFAFKPVYAELDTLHVDDDLMENRMIIPLRDAYFGQPLEDTQAQQIHISTNLGKIKEFSAATAATDHNGPPSGKDLASHGSGILSSLATCDKLPVSSVAANGNDGNVPTNVLDNNLNTRWSNHGVGSWIQLDLGSKESICSVDIAWYRGNLRQNNFVISLSNDGINFVNKLTGKSSGTTLALEKYHLPTGTEGRYVRITVNGNTENNWASITEITVFGQVGGTPGGDAGLPDKFGIKKLYPSKVGGEQWYLGEPGLLTGGTQLKKISDFGPTYQIESSQVRLRVPPPSSGYHPDQIATLDQSKMQSKGYMQAPTDWKNVEITGRFVVKSYTDSTVNGAAHIALSSRGGTHTSSAPCEGTAYWANLYVTGRSKFEKELQHTAGYTTTNPQKVGAVGPLENKWIGLKHVIYTLPSGAVKQEHWYEEYVGNKWSGWKKIFENTDSGSWGGGNPNCGGSDNTIMRWGGPLTFFRWDNIDNMYFRLFSIREIVPP